MATLEQHRWYRGVVLPLLASEWGWAVLGELHYRLKEFHIHPSLWVDGEPPSCADLDVEQFADFLEAVLRHAGEDRIYIPPPRGEE